MEESRPNCHRPFVVLDYVDFDPPGLVAETSETIDCCRYGALDALRTACSRMGDRPPSQSRGEKNGSSHGAHGGCSHLRVPNI